MNIHSFIRKHGLKMKSEGGEVRTDSDGWKHFAFRCVISAGPATMTLPYRMGMAHEGKTPKLSEVLDCIASDASGLYEGVTFEEWARDYGYDEDSRKAERIFEACKEQTRDFENLLGLAALRELVEEVERL